MPSSAERLHEWVASVRAKFGLPEERLDEPREHYWRGYNDALGDVDRFADQLGQGDDDGN